MAGSIPASATSESPLSRPAPAATARARGRRAWGRVAGSLGVGITGVLITVALLASRLAPGDPFASVAAPLQPPSGLHLMGTDDLGRDLFSGVVHGARTSLVVAGAVTVLALLLGVTVGAISGWRGALVDDLLMRLTEFVQVVPRFFLAVVVIALFGPGLDRLVLLLGLTSWPLIARVVRAEVWSLKTRDFIEAARSLGAPAARILCREILPGVLPAAIVVASVNAAGVILLEAGLSFLGLGDPHVVSWGYLANNAQRFLRVAWWMVLFPGAAIALAVLGFNLAGDALSDALNRQLDG
jgi:peptide/nickel transport system permease protein